MTQPMVVALVVEVQQEEVDLQEAEVQVPEDQVQVDQLKEDQVVTHQTLQEMHLVTSHLVSQIIGFLDFNVDPLLPKMLTCMQRKKLKIRRSANLFVTIKPLHFTKAKKLLRKNKWRVRFKPIRQFYKVMENTLHQCLVNKSL